MPVYEVRLAESVNGNIPDMPDGVKLLERGEHTLQFMVDDPERCNPLLMSNLVNAGLQVVSFHEKPRSLEQAYLAAMLRSHEAKHHA
jgi:hypothetical protein